MSEAPAAAAGSRAVNERWRVPSAVVPAAVYVGVHVVLALAALYGAHEAHLTSSELLSGWDGQHYLAIATNGYPRHPDLHTYSLVAFLPGYPLAVHALAVVTRLSPLGAALVVSQVSGLALVVVAVSLVEGRHGREAAVRAGVTLAVFPGAMMTTLPYAEGLAALWCALALVSLERERALRAGLFGLFATLTSPVVAPLAVVMGWRALRRRDPRWLGAAALTAAGFGAFMVYLGVRTGDALAWFTEQRDGFGHHLAPLGPYGSLHHWPGIGLTVLASAAVAAAGFLAMARLRVREEWALYAGLIVATILFDSGTWLNPRFLFNAFPLVLALGAWLRRGAFVTVVSVFAALTPVLFLLYMTQGNVMSQP